MLTPVTEVTRKVIGERRLRTLRELGSRTSSTRSIGTTSDAIVQALGGNAPDLPFTLLYLSDPKTVSGSY